MKKIIDWLAKWPKDKVLHFAASLLAALVVACVVRLLGGDSLTVAASGWFAGILLGIGKELIDDIKRDGKADAGDLLADAIGTTLGSVFAFVLSL